MSLLFAQASSSTASRSLSEESVARRALLPVEREHVGYVLRVHRRHADVACRPPRRRRSDSDDTVFTPLAFAAPRARAPGLIGEKPSVFCRTRSPWKLRSIALPTDALMPAANTVTNTTTARPIISAPAVTAVRPGLRTAFSRARRPVRPRSRSSGHPHDRGERAHQLAG